MIVSIGLVVVFMASVAMLTNEGIWNNIITLVNVILAALLATSLFEPVADWLDSLQPTLTYFWDFLALWSLFAIFFAVFRIATDMLSKTRVRYKSIIDRIGGGILAIWIGWVLISFTAMSLHTSPLRQNFFLGSSQPAPETRMLYGWAPDQQWLGFTQKMSAGSFSTSPPEGVEGELGANVFDPQADFIYDYGERRERLEMAPEFRVLREN